jgi:hypothetical protein
VSPWKAAHGEPRGAHHATFQGDPRFRLGALTVLRAARNGHTERPAHVGHYRKEYPARLRRIKPGASYGYRFGASLAATPSITFDGSISGAFNQRTTATTTEGTAFILPATTLVFLNAGAGFLLSQDLSLLLNASAGVTRDTPNFVLSASLPFRF